MHARHHVAHPSPIAPLLALVLAIAATAFAPQLALAYDSVPQSDAQISEDDPRVGIMDFSLLQAEDGKFTLLDNDDELMSNFALLKKRRSSLSR